MKNYEPLDTKFEFLTLTFCESSNYLILAVWIHLGFFFLLFNLGFLLFNLGFLLFNCQGQMHFYKFTTCLQSWILLQSHYC